MRHVLTRLAYLEEQIDAKHLIILHLNTSGMIADIGTKVLPASTFHSHRVSLSAIETSPRAEVYGPREGAALLVCVLILVSRVSAWTIIK
jgi:hypothetical protein